VTIFIIPGIQNITRLGDPNSKCNKHHANQNAANTNENHQTPKKGKKPKKTGKKTKIATFLLQFPFFRNSAVTLVNLNVLGDGYSIMATLKLDRHH